MALRPNETLVWRWGHLVPVKYHGRIDISVFGPRKDGGKTWGGHAADWICNGLWEYRPDFNRELWRRGADRVENVLVQNGELIAADGKTGAVIWKMHSPYPFVGGKLNIDGAGVKFSLSWDGAQWIEIADELEALFHFPHKGDARYRYWLKCELSSGARLKRLAILNDLQMAPLSLPGMMVGENRFFYTDESPGDRKVRLTHEWVERSLSRPPAAPAAPIFPIDGGHTEDSQVDFRWQAANDPDGEHIADYHFQLASRPDMAWPLSTNFEKLISNTKDRGNARYGMPYAGLLTPGETYYWRVRARDAQGVWGPWSKTWSFTTGGPAQPVDVRLEEVDGDATHVALRWRPNPRGTTPVKYRIYASDEKGFSAADAAHRMNVGRSAELSAQSSGNFVAETSRTELIVVGPGADTPTAAASSEPAMVPVNKAFYRVVAVDERGHRSGPSDYANAPRPFIFSAPAAKTAVGRAYQYSISTIRSLGDLRSQLEDGKTVTKFWDIEQPRFTLVEGPDWLRLDERTGQLTGVPDAAGTADVVVRVVLERPFRRLDDSRLSWGHENVKEAGTERIGSATQRFRMTIDR
jgi:hypothetical protein